MRRKSVEEPKWKRSTRTRKAFLWFPRSVRTFPNGFGGREVVDSRWLEVAEWEETIKTIPMHETWHLGGDKYWETTQWLDK